ncbi:hypothetical protein CFB46_28000 [Burkholderia sp. HI2761]|nr:hypothetical protein [Burkholderia sp. BE24]OXJ24589.1 hypothetical protein CFB46_28000 [Burkholderia sp. HI2761]
MISRPIRIGRRERIVFPAILVVSNDIDSASPNGSNCRTSSRERKNMTLLDPVCARRVAAVTHLHNIRIHVFRSVCRTTRGYAHAGREMTNG